VGEWKEIKRVVKCLTLPNKTQYRLSKLAIRCDPEDIRRPKCGFEDGCKRKGALISFRTYDTLQRRRLENERNKYYLSLYLT
jgi:hypothetical protein